MTEEVTIQYEDVYKRFDTPVLSGVSLSVMRGETISILGTSGTGKSVLLKTTIGLITPDRGDVKIDGESVYHSSAVIVRDLRRAVRYVFQYAALFDSLNIYDNVAMGLDPETIRNLAKKTMLERIAASLENVNLDPAKVLSKLPAELSGGMRKRVGLARAIVGEPRIILYDEPVTGLDPVNAATVNRLIMSNRGANQGDLYRGDPGRSRGARDVAPGGAPGQRQASIRRQSGSVPQERRPAGHGLCRPAGRGPGRPEADRARGERGR